MKTNGGQRKKFSDTFNPPHVLNGVTGSELEALWSEATFCSPKLFHGLTLLYTVTCMMVHATDMTSSSSDDWIY
jgi:hypothetical protein